jgi:hypothetical protein
MCSSVRQLGRRGRLPPGGVPRASATDQATDCRIRPCIRNRAERFDEMGLVRQQEAGITGLQDHFVGSST